MTDDLWTTIESCWAHQISARPSAEHLVKKLLTVVSSAAVVPSKKRGDGWLAVFSLAYGICFSLSLELMVDVLIHAFLGVGFDEQIKRSLDINLTQTLVTDRYDHSIDTMR